MNTQDKSRLSELEAKPNRSVEEEGEYNRLNTEKTREGEKPTQGTVHQSDTRTV